MIKLKKKVCKSCNTEQHIFSGKMCKPCWSKEQQTRIKKISDRQKDKIDKKKEETHLMKLAFKSFYNNHLTKCCEECSEKITELRTYNVHHLLEKRNYPEYKFDLNNFMLLCGDCHSTYESLSKGDKIIERLNKLKENYNL